MDKKEITSTSDVKTVIADLAKDRGLSELEMTERIIQGILSTFDTNNVINN